jgi:hypothetical protein
MNRWLQGYAYNTNISFWLLTGIMVVVLFTALRQVLKAVNSTTPEK